MGVLGCGTYQVHVRTRGGKRLVTTIPAEGITWARVLDDTSEAQIVATVPFDADCRPALADIRPWRHELELIRDDGLGNVEPVWVGPLFQIRTPAEQYNPTARDLSAWWDHRLVHNDHIWPVAADLAVVFKTVSDDAMEPDTSPGLTVEPKSSGVRATFTVLANQNQYAGTVLRDISKIGIDWTLLNRHVLIGGTEIPTRNLGTFTDEYFDTPPTPTFDGSVQSNRVVVGGSGAGSVGNDVYASAKDASSIRGDGLLESFQSLSSIQDQVAAAAAAATSVELAKDVTGVQDCVLSRRAPIRINDLIPGSLCTLALTDTVVPIFGTFRLQSITVSAGGNASGADETIALAFQPPGTVAA